MDLKLSCIYILWYNLWVSNSYRLATRKIWKITLKLGIVEIFYRYRPLILLDNFEVSLCLLVLLIFINAIFYHVLQYSTINIDSTTATDGSIERGTNFKA